MKEILKVRVDKWLWSVRFFKSRTAATTACDKGWVKIGDEAVKASRNIKPGERISFRHNHITREVEVVRLIEKRVGAPIAVTCYLDHTPEEELKRTERPSFFNTGHRERGAGRPTKKERRQIDDLKDIDYDE